MEPAPSDSSRGATPSGNPAASGLPAGLAARLCRLDSGLATLYGEQYGGLAPYGSCARGEAYPWAATWTCSSW
jgi:hypothetical protein